MKHNTTLVELCFRTSRNFPSFQGKTVPSHASKTGIYDPQSHRSIPKIKDETAASQKFAYLEAKSLIDIFRCDLFWSSNWSTFFFESSFIIRKLSLFCFFSLDSPKNWELSKRATNTSCSKVKSPNFRSVSTRNLELSTGKLEGLGRADGWESFWTSRTQTTYISPRIFWEQNHSETCDFGRMDGSNCSETSPLKGSFDFVPIAPYTLLPKWSTDFLWTFFWKFEASSYSSFRHLNPHKFLPTLKWTSALVSRQFTRK